MNNILVIEDEECISLFLQKALTKMGFKVKIAGDGEEGIDMLNNGHNFDLVITDINMPKMNGNAVARYIRSSGNSNLPIVAITGSDDIEKDLFNFVLTKPFRMDALAGIIGSYG